MRTITRHVLRPGCTADAIDDLDAVMTPEVAALCRATVDVNLGQLEQLRAWEKLKDKHGLSLHRFSERTDATHYLTCDRKVFLLRL